MPILDYPNEPIQSLIYAFKQPTIVRSVTPNSGPVIGETAITITGQGFNPGAIVTIGGVVCSAVVVVSPLALTCLTPVLPTGAGDVTVTNLDTTTGTLAGGFTAVASPGLFAYLPAWYQQSAVMTQTLTQQGAQFDLMVQAIQSVTDAAYVMTAPDWGLSLWESELALPDPKTVSPPLSFVERQSRILQQLRGARSPTIPNIEASIMSWGNGAATIYEDIPNYTVWILFAGGTGLPSNRAVMEAGVRALMPAHLVVNFIYGTLIWGQASPPFGLDGHAFTWDELDALALTWDQFENLGN